MKSAVENLDPTRVRLTVEVPFEELKPNLDAAYKKIAEQVNVPGFRRGKVPPRIIDQRIGRAAVLEEAVNEALPNFYSRAVEESKLAVIGRPEVEVTEFGDGADFKFTAEVDVRPEIELPEYEGIEVSVDDAVVSEEKVDEQLDALRDRFASLNPVERAVANGDYVTLDLVAKVGGEELEDGSATGVSYEVGSDTMLDGLDEAITGKSAGDEVAFTSKLVGGSRAGEDAEIEVKVGTVKEKELPELDDDWASEASEFDTVDELRADIRTRLERAGLFEQGAAARDKVLEALLDRVDVPLPVSVVQAEIDWRNQQLDEQLEAAGMTREGFFKLQDKPEDEYTAEQEKEVRDGVKAQFILDTLANKEELTVGQDELTQHLIRRAAGSGLTPDQFAQQVVQSGQVPLLVGEVRRGKALQIVLEAAKITDASGNEVDLKKLDEANDAVAETAAPAETTETVETAEA